MSTFSHAHPNALLSKLIRRILFGTATLLHQCAISMSSFSREGFKTIKPDLIKAIIFGTAALLITFLHNWATSLDSHNQQRLNEYSERSKELIATELTLEPATRYLKWRYWYYLDDAGKRGAQLTESDIKQLERFERQATDAEADWNKNDKVSFFMLTTMFDGSNAGSTELNTANYENAINSQTVDCGAQNFGPAIETFRKQHQPGAPLIWHRAMIVCFDEWFDQIKEMRRSMDYKYAVDPSDEEKFKKTSDDAHVLGDKIYEREKEYESLMQSQLRTKRDKFEQQLRPNWLVRFFSNAS